MSDQAAPPTSQGLSRFLLFPAITVCWGSNWPAIKLSVLEMPIWQYRAVTAIAAGLMLLGLALASRRPIRVPRRQWGALLAISITNVTGWLILAAYGVKLLKSGQAALLGYTAPLWVVILARIILGEALTLRKLGAIAIGLSGILVLLWPSLGKFGDQPLGIICITGAAMSFGAGTVITKRVNWAVPPMRPSIGSRRAAGSGPGRPRSSRRRRRPTPGPRGTTSSPTASATWSWATR